MSEIMTVYRLDTGEFRFVLESEALLIDVIKAEIEGTTLCLGNTLEFKIEVGEMQRHEFEALKEFES